MTTTVIQNDVGDRARPPPPSPAPLTPNTKDHRQHSRPKFATATSSAGSSQIPQPMIPSPEAVLSRGPRARSPQPDNTAVPFKGQSSSLSAIERSRRVASMLTRTISKGFETATRTRSIEFKDTDAVIYDPLNRTLFQGSLKALEPEQHIQVPIKDCRTKVDICVPLSPSPRPGRDPKRANSDSTVYIATVDLRRLGKCVKNGVRSGRIKNVYVLGYVPDRMGNHSDGEDGDEE